MMRESDHIARADVLPIDVLASEVDRRRIAWLDTHPGWVFTGTALVKCLDGTPPPAYDVSLGFRRPRTPSEKAAQDQDREAYVAHKEADFARRAEEQKALLEQVLSSLNS